MEHGAAPEWKRGLACEFVEVGMKPEMGLREEWRDELR